MKMWHRRPRRCKNEQPQGASLYFCRDLKLHKKIAGGQGYPPHRAIF